MNSSRETDTDVLIVGGGPAGLSAALVLGRCGRRVVVCDNGHPRNAAAMSMNGYLTRDGINPREFLRIARHELTRYPGVTVRDTEVANVTREAAGFSSELAGGEIIISRKVLLATGVRDKLPEIPGLRELYGRYVFHCPYCDGWGVREKRLAALGEGEKGYNLALKLTVWSNDVLLLLNGHDSLEEQQRADLNRLGIRLAGTSIESLEERGGGLQVKFDDGSNEQLGALFFSTGTDQAAGFGTGLGCKTDDSDGIETDKHERTSIEGCFAAGNMTKDVEFVIVAAAEGAKAAMGINIDLLRDDLAAQGVEYPD